MEGRNVMRYIALLLIQIVLSFFVVGLLMPALLATMPQVRGSTIGPALAMAAAGVIFLVLRLVWPRPKSE